MKKLILSLSLVAALSAGVTVFAAETYDSEKNELSSDTASGKKTVLVTKASENVGVDDIVYIDQADGTFNAGVSFLLKANPTEGEYKVSFSDGENTTSKTFYIGWQELDSDVKMDAVGEAEEVTGGWGKGYTATVKAGNCKSVIIKNGDELIGCKLGTEISGESDVLIGLQINADSEDALNSLGDVYISARELAE